MGRPPVCPRCASTVCTCADLPASGLELARRTFKAVPASFEPAQTPNPLPRLRGSARKARTGETRWQLPAREAALEFQLRLLAIPVALLVAWLCAHAGLPRLLMRTFLSMWVHESGHAVSAWLFGFPAFPGPWFTPIGASRSWLFSGAFMAGVGYLGYRNWNARRTVGVALCGLALLLQVVLTALVSVRRAQEWMIFGGDAGCLILGTLLMTTFYVRRHDSIRTGWLRWGFLVIGAAAFADAYATWWAARTDWNAIPFGESERSGLSDPSRLVDEYGWAVSTLVNRYVVLGALCLLVLGVFYAWGLVRARTVMRDPHAEGIPPAPPES